MYANKKEFFSECCGQAVQVKGVYDYDTKKEFIFTLCKKCLMSTEINIDKKTFNRNLTKI